MGMKISEEFRVYLKKPLGEIVEELPESGNKIITIGDYTLRRFLKKGIKPNIAIFDYKIMRLELPAEGRKEIEEKLGEAYIFDNPPGTLPEDMQGFVELAKRKKYIRIKGEEDLLLLPFVLYMDKGWTMYYGQPKVGLVKVVPNKELKKKIREYLGLDQ